MSTTFARNTSTYNGHFLNENILKDDGVTYEEAVSVNDAIVKHFIYYLKTKFNEALIYQSSTSAGTQVTIIGRYPEKERLVDIAPAVIVSIDEEDSAPLTVGSNHLQISGNPIKGRSGKFRILFDCWAHNLQEINIVLGITKRILDDASFDDEMLFTRGINHVKYAGTDQREFDVSDNYANYVSHEEASVNIRRRQVLYDIEFIYRVYLGLATFSVPKNRWELVSALNTKYITETSTGKKT